MAVSLVWHPKHMLDDFPLRLVLLIMRAKIFQPGQNMAKRGPVTSS